MGRMKEIYMEIVESSSYENASEKERLRMIAEWQESDEINNRTDDRRFRNKRHRRETSTDRR